MASSKTTFKNTGDRMSLVFLHYFGGSANSWEFVISELERDFDCIALNLPGFGNTPVHPQPSLANCAAFVKQQLKNMAIDRYVLIGHSMGGKIALQCAVEDPDQAFIEALILIAPSPPSFEAIPESKQKKMRQIPNLVESRKSVDQDTIIKLKGKQLDIAVQSPLEVDISARAWWIDEGIHQSIARETKNIKIPITVVASEVDPAITMKMTVEETLPNLPDSTQLKTIDGIGHLIPLENPKLTAAIISEILNEKHQSK